MPLFRLHRGDLQDSINTTKIVKNLDDIRNIVYEDWEMWEGALRQNDDQPFSKDVFDLKIKSYVWDPRTGWYTQIVSADLTIKGEFMAIGFLSEPFT